MARQLGARVNSAVRASCYEYFIVQKLIAAAHPAKLKNIGKKDKNTYFYFFEIADVMAYTFTNNDIEQISSVLCCRPKEFENSWSWALSASDASKMLIFSVHNDVNLGKGVTGSMVSAQTQQGYLELHNCKGYLTFEPDEVIFIAEEANKVSSLIIGKNATCSLYSNIDRSILSSDITTLDAAVLMAAMQLSITEEKLC